MFKDGRGGECIDATFADIPNPGIHIAPGEGLYLEEVRILGCYARYTPRYGILTSNIDYLPPFRSPVLFLHLQQECGAP